MTIKRLIQKAFIGGQWYVGYRRKGDTKYSVIETPKDMWIADPTMFAANGEHYLFVEVYENKQLSRLLLAIIILKQCSCLQGD